MLFPRQKSNRIFQKCANSIKKEVSSPVEHQKIIQFMRVCIPHSERPFQAESLFVFAENGSPKLCWIWRNGVTWPSWVPPSSPLLVVSFARMSVLLKLKVVCRATQTSLPAPSRWPANSLVKRTPVESECPESSSCQNQFALKFDTFKKGSARPPFCCFWCIPFKRTTTKVHPYSRRFFFVVHLVHMLKL